MPRKPSSLLCLERLEDRYLLTGMAGIPASNLTESPPLVNGQSTNGAVASQASSQTTAGAGAQDLSQYGYLGNIPQYLIIEANSIVQTANAREATLALSTSGGVHDQTPNPGNGLNSSPSTNANQSENTATRATPNSQVATGAPSSPVSTENESAASSQTTNATTSTSSPVRAEAMSGGTSSYNAARATSESTSSVSSSVTATGSTGLASTPPANPQRQTGDLATVGLTQQVIASVTTDVSGIAATLGYSSDAVRVAMSGLNPPNSNPYGIYTSVSSSETLGASGRSSPVGDGMSSTPIPQNVPPQAEDDADLVRNEAPLGAGLLDGSTPITLNALDLGVQQFLGQIEDLGREVTHALQDTSVAVWVVAASIGIVTYEILRRRRRARLALLCVGGPNYLADSWVPGLSGPLSEEP